MRRTGGNVQGGSATGPSTPGESTPWGERQRHQQVDEAAKDEWQSIQKKTFTRWCNSHLKQRALEIGDLFTDVSDGILLLNLLEIIGGDSIYSVCKRKWNPKPKLRIHHLENCNLIFEYLKVKELNLTNIGSTDIVDTNKKLVLGLLWTIILRFAIAEDGKQGLLLWCQRSTEGYAGVSIDNFDFSWRDGRGFLALINKYRPDVLNYDESAGTDPRANLTLAFNVARDSLGIDAVLDPEDLLESAKPDEKSIVAYLSLFFAKFASLTRKQALVDAILKAVSVTRKHDGLIQRYKSSARALRGWLTTSTESMQTPDACRTTEEIREKMDALQEYRKTEKPANKAVLLELNSILGQLRVSQRSNLRPLYVPEPDLSDKALWEEVWPALEAAEQAYEQALIAKYSRFTLMDFTITKVHNKLAKLEPWLESRATYFDNTDYGTSVSSCEQKLSSVQAFEAQAAVYGGLLSGAERLAADLSDEHAKAAPTKVRLAAAGELLVRITAAAEAYKLGVSQRLTLERELLDAALKYGTLANEVSFMLDEVDEALSEPILGNSVEEVTSAKELFGALAARFHGFEVKVVELEALALKITSAGRESTLETPASSLRSTFERLSSSIATHTDMLTQAVSDTERKVATRRAFAEAAEDLNTYVQETTEASNLAGRRTSMKAEAITQKLHKLKEEYKVSGRGKMDVVEEASAAQEALGVIANGFTVQTIYSLRISFEELGKLLDSRLDAHLAALAAAQSQNALSEEQLREVGKVFEALDRDRTGSLSLKEYREGLQGLGILMDDSEADRKFHQLCKTSPGHLTLPEFAEFMVTQLCAGSSQEDILAAFRTLAGASTITADQIKLYFARDDTPAYMLDHMPQKGEAYEYEPFTVAIFER